MLMAKYNSLEAIYQHYPKDKLEHMGITLTSSPATKRVEERSFEEIIHMFTFPYATHDIKNNPLLRPYSFTTEDRKRIEQQAKSKDEIVKLAHLYNAELDNGRVSKTVEGLLTNNSQVTYYFQENLNQELLDIAQQLNNIQKAFIALLSDEEIKKFAI